MQISNPTPDNSSNAVQRAGCAASPVWGTVPIPAVGVGVGVVWPGAAVASEVTVTVVFPAVPGVGTGEAGLSPG